MTTALSIIAISISVLTFAWTIAWSIYTHRRATQPGVKVKGSFATPVYGPALGAPCLGITVTNTGAVTITITSARFAIDGKQETLAPIAWVMQTPEPLPVVLAPGGHWDGLADADLMHNSLVRQYGGDGGWRLQPVVADSAGREYRATEWLTI
jgi:hypothetical protein